MPKVKFLPTGKEVEATSKVSLFELMRDVGIRLESSCGGKKKCGKCKVIIKDGESGLPLPDFLEKEILGHRLLEKGYRLACSVTVNKDITVIIPAESRAGRQKILSSASSCISSVTPSPTIRPYYVEVQAPSLPKPASDLGRIFEALKRTYGLKNLMADPYLARKVPRVLRASEGAITALIKNNREIIDIRADSAQALYGMAFDVGTTTVVGYLFDLIKGKEACVKTAMNPQIPFGDDIISRISFSNENNNGLEKLRSSIVECINKLIQETTSCVGIDSSDVVDLAIVGNTAMHHFLLGLDPCFLALAPFPPVISQAQDFKARDLGIQICPSAYVHLLPVKAGFVGSDTIACILSSGLYKSKDPVLLIDLGTNGEIVFGNRDRMICCSTAAGPAFEGRHISWGMRAAPGAIEKVSIEPRSLQVSLTTIQDKRPTGICGSGLISAVAALLQHKILLHKGNFNEELIYTRLRPGQWGMEFVLSWKHENPTANDIVITQQDIAELQMAKSAIYAGASILIEQFGSKPSRILLAGAGGNYIDPRDAMTIGLLPRMENNKVIGIGNAAGYGACLALINKTLQRRARKIAEELEYIELSGMKDFNELFTTHMFFPEFPHMSI